MGKIASKKQNLNKYFSNNLLELGTNNFFMNWGEFMLISGEVTTLDLKLKINALLEQHTENT